MRVRRSVRLNDSLTLRDSLRIMSKASDGSRVNQTLHTSTRSISTNALLRLVRPYGQHMRSTSCGERDPSQLRNLRRACPYGDALAVLRQYRCGAAGWDINCLISASYALCFAGRFGSSVRRRKVRRLQPI
jgi:hypothetical protein